MGLIAKTTIKNTFRLCMVLPVTALLLVVSGRYIKQQYNFVWTESVVFTESDKELNNPNQGFYTIYGVIVTESDGFFDDALKRLKKDSKTLAMIQINLQNYAEGSISARGLENIRNMFEELEKLDKQYIIRFLYDWDGKCAKTEPDDVEIIFEHMRQLEEIYREYEDIIFVQQGFFIGNWGEMNGTKHGEYVQQLALQLEAVTGKKTFLAVRTPAQWRNITGFSEVTKEAMMKSALGRRLGLFNDGMMGNISDCGTYGEKSKVKSGSYGLWNRQEELDFQEELCKLVPNGGEVISSNPLNDFQSAVDNFEIMHVTYLNWDYDWAILNKWKNSVVKEEGCFNGMDGLSYMQRRLGYRLLIEEAMLEHSFWTKELCVEISMKNVGFAPLYKEVELWLAVQGKENDFEQRYSLKTELDSLTGGKDSEEIFTITENISLEEFETGDYEIYFCIKDVDSGRIIELANEQELQEAGYRIGEFQVGSSFELSDENKTDVKED